MKKSLQTELLQSKQYGHNMSAITYTQTSQNLKNGTRSLIGTPLTSGRFHNNQTNNSANGNLNPSQSNNKCFKVVQPDNKGRNCLNLKNSGTEIGATPFYQEMTFEKSDFDLDPTPSISSKKASISSLEHSNSSSNKNIRDKLADKKKIKKESTLKSTKNSEPVLQTTKNAILQDTSPTPTTCPSEDKFL
jgi:hypothetical protein